MCKQEAIVNDWWLVGGPDKPFWMLCGTVVSHPHIRSGARDLRTSEVVRLDRDAGICETQNTIYRLEGPERVVTDADERNNVLDYVACGVANRCAAAGQVMSLGQFVKLLEHLATADELRGPVEGPKQ